MGEWTKFSQGAEGAGVSRCPAGHIHVELGPLSLRFDEREFLAFVRMLGQAAQSITATRRPELGDVIYGPTGAWFSLN